MRAMTRRQQKAANRGLKKMVEIATIVWSAAARDGDSPATRGTDVGFRLAQDLD
jgi:hypothetical protein